jgi:hypothetical protein
MEKAKRYKLPAWLDDLLPEEKQPVVIDVEADGMLWATMPDGARRELSMDIIEEAYDAIRGDEGEDVRRSRSSPCPKVDRFFDIDGTERPDVEYEKSEIEKTLKERVKDLPEQPEARHIPFYNFAG